MLLLPAQLYNKKKVRQFVESHCPIAKYNNIHSLTSCFLVSFVSTSRLVFTARLRPQVWMPPARNARRSSCPFPISERAEIPDFRTRSIENLWTRPMSSFWTYLFAARHVIHCRQWSRPQRVGACSEDAVLGTACGGHIALDRVSRPYFRYGDKGWLQNVSPPSVLFESSRFFTIHRRHRRKNDWLEFWNSNYVIFEIFFWNFKKASRGASAADLDRYGRGQTRSQ